MYNDWKKKERMRHQFQTVPATVNTEAMRRMVVAAGMSAYTEFAQPEPRPQPLINQPDNEE